MNAVSIALVLMQYAHESLTSLRAYFAKAPQAAGWEGNQFHDSDIAEQQVKLLCLQELAHASINDELRPDNA
jgi:hypothetical protein